MKAKRRSKGQRGGARSAWTQGLLFGALAVAAPGVAVLAGALLLPGLVAVSVAGREWRGQARAVLFAGLALSLAPVFGLWSLGGGVGGAVAVLGRGNTLPLAWGAAGVAWLLAEAVPLLIAAATEARVASQLARLRAEHAALAADWTAPGPPASAKQAASVV